MGSGGSSAKDNASSAAKSHEKHEKPAAGSNTFLLLGTMGVGKSTIAKQMQISFGSGFEEGDRTENRKSIIKNVVSSTMTVIKEAPADLFPDGVYTHMDTIAENNDVTSPEDMALLKEALLAIWKDESFLKAFGAFKPKSYSHELEYNATCWFKNKLDAILEENYSPTDEDIVKSRSMTTNVKDTTFFYNEKEFLLRDVGGQVQYRNQWKEAFSGAQVVLYIVSLDDFHKESRKEKDDGVESTSNRLVESRTLFKDIVNSETMGSVPYVLIFNKTDLFAESLKTKSLSQCPIFSKAEGQRESESFEEYTERCQRYIRSYFSKVVEEKGGKNEKRPSMGSQEIIISVHSYFTCATDTELFKSVMERSLIAIWKLMETRLTKAGF